jgi:hypothetical protein
MKTIISYHLTSVPSATGKTMWRKGNPCVLLVGMNINMTITENNIEVSQKTENKMAV